MTRHTKLPHDSPLARWSRLKREAAREKQQKEKDGAAARATSAVPGIAPATWAEGTPAASTGAPALSPESAPASSTEAPRGAPSAAGSRADDLPPIESLTFDSDFAPYFQPKVDAALKRQALKQLLRDPHFNVMDGLDVYIDDYSKPDPIAPEIVREMVQGRYIFDPPPTRINAQGHVEDVPPEELAALREAKPENGSDALEPGETTPALADTVPEPEDAGSAPAMRDDEIPPPAIPSEAPVAKDESAR